MYTIKYSFGKKTYTRSYKSYNKLEESVERLVKYSEEHRRPVVIKNMVAGEIYQTGISCADGTTDYVDKSAIR